MQQQQKSITAKSDDNSIEKGLNETLDFKQGNSDSTDAKPVKITDMKRELNALRKELHVYRVQNADLKDANQDLTAKLSRLQNTIDNLQRTVREQAVKTLDEMFFGLKK
jgi:predicted RNase H-like nuclease (RuvC/YqgF family)